MRYIIIIFFFSCIANSICLGQNRNESIFIEPNTYFEFDRSKYSIIYKSNTRNFESEVLINSSKDTNFNCNIKVYNILPQKSSLIYDTLYEKFINYLSLYKSDSILINVEDTFKVNDFYCVSVLTRNKSEIKHLIKGFRANEKILCEVTSESANINMVNNVEYFSELLKGIKLFSSKEIENEVDRLRNSYSIIVDTNSFSYEDRLKSKLTFIGIVRVKEKLNDSLVEIRLIGENSTTIFNERRDKGILIYFYDNSVIRTKKCKAIFKNAFGKLIDIEFELIY